MLTRRSIIAMGAGPTLTLFSFAAPKARDRSDPYRAYPFLLELEGIARAVFMECSGLDVGSPSIEYRQGSDPTTVRKLPGLWKYSYISLKRGITDDAELWQWCKGAIDGRVERKNGSIIVRDGNGATKARWNFREGWPTNWTGPTLNSTGNEVAIETLDIAHEGLEKG